ncbi:MAG: hypothetical protein AAFV80_03480 [Bacteroidota bacterium]
MKKWTFLIPILLLFTTTDSFSQPDFTNLGVQPIDLTVLSNETQINLGQPMLIKRSVAKDHYRGSAGVDEFFLEFKASQAIAEQKINKYHPKRSLANKFLATFHNSKDTVTTELTIRRVRVQSTATYEDRVSKAVNFRFYSIALTEVPLPLLLSSDKMEIDLYLYE